MSLPCWQCSHHTLLSLQMWHTTQVASALPPASLLPPGFEPAAFAPLGGLVESRPSSCSGEQDSSTEELTVLLVGPGGSTAQNQGLPCPTCPIGSKKKGLMTKPGAEDEELKQCVGA